MATILLGLLSAFAYGILDLLFVLAARFYKQLNLLAWMHGIAALMLLLFASASYPTPSPLFHWHGLSLVIIVGIALGTFNAMGNVAAFRAFLHGPVGLVSLTVSAYGLIPLLLAFLLLGEPFTLPQAGCAAFMVIGLCMLTRPAPPADASQNGSGKKLAASLQIGVLWACLAAWCFGTEVFVTAKAAPTLGLLSLLLCSRAFSSGLLFAIAFGKSRMEIAPLGIWPSLGRWCVIVVMALVDLGAVALFVWGSFTSVSLVSGLAMTYPAFALVLGMVGYKERPTRLQWAGVACLGSGVLLLAFFAA
jgi:drug/metabolite transporter (DMT)-like permease